MFLKGTQLAISGFRFLDSISESDALPLIYKAAELPTQGYILKSTNPETKLNIHNYWFKSFHNFVGNSCGIYK